jgi:hypothetical protein
MKYYAISTDGAVINLYGKHQTMRYGENPDDLSGAWERALCGPWEIAGVFTEEQIKSIAEQINIRELK